METFHLEEYLSNGVENIIKGIIKASLKNPKASRFMIQYSFNNDQARNKRLAAERQGEHIPPFLIASITDKCNLHCKGCYARSNKSCTDICSQESINRLMTEQNWNDIFTQAEDLGIEFILLAGGEPFVRKDVISVAGKHQSILFPIFTNGTMIENSYLELLNRNRNLLPILSIEGNQSITDARRGEGIYHKLQNTMKELHSRGIIFGSSVTVAKHNMKEVLSDEFIQNLKNAGSKAIIYVEYVPMDESSRKLVLDDADRIGMMQCLNKLRTKESKMVFIAFPGDEKSSGGCLAAGRGFFHINAYGGAEPCPFSPYSDTSILDTSLREALHSPIFVKLQKSGSLMEEHTGGCVIFQHQEQVKELLNENL